MSGFRGKISEDDIVLKRSPSLGKEGCRKDVSRPRGSILEWNVSIAGEYTDLTHNHPLAGVRVSPRPPDMEIGRKSLSQFTVWHRGGCGSQKKVQVTGAHQRLHVCL